EVAPGVAVAAGAPRAAPAGRGAAVRRHGRGKRPGLVVAFLSFFFSFSPPRAAGTRARGGVNPHTPESALLPPASFQGRRPRPRRLFALVTRIGYRLADGIVTTSEGVADDLVAAFGVARARIRVVHNPVRLDVIGAMTDEPLDPSHQCVWSRPAIVAAGR